MSPKTGGASIRLPAGSVGNVQTVGASDQIVGFAQVHKRVYRIVDLALSGIGQTELTFGLQGEIKLFADMPIFVAVEDPGNMIGPISEVAYRGDIRRIFVARQSNFATGRLVVYTARPFFAAGFERELPEGKIAPGVTIPTFQITAGNDTGSSIIVPVGTGAATSPNEAYYIDSFSFDRDGGTIDRIQYIENESGAGYSLLDHTFGTAVDRGTVRFQRPIRISSSGYFFLTGSIEAVNTDIDVCFTGAAI